MRGPVTPCVSVSAKKCAARSRQTSPLNATQLAAQTPSGPFNADAGVERWLARTGVLPVHFGKGALD
jgi:hypothetical protein